MSRICLVGMNMWKWSKCGGAIGGIRWEEIFLKESRCICYIIGATIKILKFKYSNFIY